MGGRTVGRASERPQEWRSMKSCIKRELLSMIRHFSHVCKAVRAGRSFLWRLLDLSLTVKQLDRQLHLNVSTRADLEWWWHFGLQAFMVQRKAGPGPFFQDKDGKALTRADEVRKALSKAGMASYHISGHSFRIGAVTAAAQGDERTLR